MRPLLATIPPMNPAGRRGGGAMLVPSLNDRIYQFGAAENMPIVDVYAAFNGNLTLLGDDGLHPNAGGLPGDRQGVRRRDQEYARGEGGDRPARSDVDSHGVSRVAQDGDGAIQVGVAHEQIVGVVGGDDEDADRGSRQRAGERRDDPDEAEVQRSAHASPR